MGTWGAVAVPHSEMEVWITNNVDSFDTLF